MEKTIKKGQAVSAVIDLPPSKSLSHRALLAASLANGESKIYGLGTSMDITATKTAMMHLGVRFEEGEPLLVHGPRRQVYDGNTVDCCESGSTLRFLIPIFALHEGMCTFTGRGRLMERPLTIYEQLWKERDMTFEMGDVLHVQGPLRSGAYVLDGNVSSQFITGLLFALPLCEGDSTIYVKEPFESRSYVGLTLDILARAGIHIESEGNLFRIGGHQTYQAGVYDIPGDDSQMVFFAACALLYNVPIVIRRADHDSKQGDHVLLQHMQAFGGVVEEISEGYCIRPGTLHGAQIDLGDCPDLGPMLFALASQIPGTTTFTHCERLRMKESDRIACMEEELHRLGCSISSQGGTVIVQGHHGILPRVTVSGHNDHRIVMALSVLAGIGEGTTITGAQAIAKSYPGFFEDLAKTGVEIC